MPTSRVPPGSAPRAGCAIPAGREAESRFRASRRSPSAAALSRIARPYAYSVVMCVIRIGVRSRAATPITPSPKRNLGADAGGVVAAARNRVEALSRLVRHQDHRVLDVEQRLAAPDSVSSSSPARSLHGAMPLPDRAQRAEQVAARHRRRQRRARDRLERRARGRRRRPRRRNTPLIPVCDAMPASFAFMLSNSGPVGLGAQVLRRRAGRSRPSPGRRPARVARGLASTFSRVLLKNWNDSATCSASTKFTCDRYETFGVPSTSQVAMTPGTAPSRQSRIASTASAQRSALERRARRAGRASARTPPTA